MAHLDCDIVELAQLFGFHSNLRGKFSGWADNEGRNFAR